MTEKRHPRLALLVLPPGARRQTLVSCLESLELAAATVGTCREVHEYLRANPQIDVIITQVTLKDGNWCDVLSCVVSSGVDARVIVASPVADERFWSEALWRGVYDLIVEPYDRVEVTRIVGGALRASTPYGPLPVVMPASP